MLKVNAHTHIHTYDLYTHTHVYICVPMYCDIRTFDFRLVMADDKALHWRTKLFLFTFLSSIYKNMQSHTYTINT